MAASRRPPRALLMLVMLLLGGGAPCLQASARPVETNRAGTGRYGDLAARAVLPWAGQTILYQVWLNAYGPDHAFQHVEARLPHSAELGVTMMQLSPIHPHPAGSPYSVEDYAGINPAYGTAADFHSLIDAAHRLGLKVIMDVVFVHTSPTNPLLKEHPEMYLHDAAGKIVLSQWHLPRLDPNNPETQKYLIGTMAYWVKEFGVDGFRADVASGLGADFWNKARTELDKVKPDLFMLAESTAPELMLHAFDATYGVRHMWTLFKILGYGAPASELKKNWEADRAKFPKGTLILRALDNHDQRRAITQFGNDGALAGMVINLTLDGIPFIYNGQEIGDSNPTGINHFFPIQWEQERTGSMEIEGIKFHRGSYAGEDWPIYKNLVALRKTHSALTDGKVIWVPNSAPDRIVSYLRKDKNQEILVVVNVSNEPWTGTIGLSPEENVFQSLLSHNAVPGVLPNDRLTYSLGSFGYFLGERVAPKVMQ